MYVYTGSMGGRTFKEESLTQGGMMKAGRKMYSRQRRKA